MALLRGLQVYGETFGPVPGSSTRWGAMLPVAGKGWIERLYLMATGAGVVGSQTIWRPFWNDNIPTTDLQLRAGELLFAHAKTTGTPSGDLVLGVDGAPFELRGPFWFEPEGRRLTWSVYNTGANTMNLSALMVWRPSDAESSDEPQRRAGDR